MHWSFKHIQFKAFSQWHLSRLCKQWSINNLHKALCICLLVTQLRNWRIRVLKGLAKVTQGVGSWLLKSQTSDHTSSTQAMFIFRAGIGNSLATVTFQVSGYSFINSELSKANVWRGKIWGMLQEWESWCCQDVDFSLRETTEVFQQNLVCHWPTGRWWWHCLAASLCEVFVNVATTDIHYNIQLSTVYSVYATI